jgi:hypothetical protein
MHRLFVREALKRQRNFGPTSIPDTEDWRSSYVAEFLESALARARTSYKSYKYQILIDTAAGSRAFDMLHFRRNKACNMKRAPRFHEAPWSIQA